MIRLINIRLYKGNNIEYEQNKIKAIFNEENVSFIVDDIKTIINKDNFIRENDDYKFIIDINKKESLYTLKKQNMSFDIDVEKVSFEKKKENIIFTYKISTEDEEFKLIIERDENNE